MEVTYKVYRKDPEQNGSPSYSSYRVELDDDATVMDGLLKIRNEMDDTLAFRSSCCQGYCGECSMRINYRASLACSTKVAAVTKNGPEVLLDPMRNIPVIKDLVFDMDAFLWNKIKAVKPWLEPRDESAATETAVPDTDMATVRKLMSCYHCGLCDEGCAVLPVDFNFLGPAALTKGYKFLVDPRDSAREERLKVLQKPKGMWDCAHCYEANSHCPRGLAPSDKIMEMRDWAFKSGITNEKVARHHQSFLQSVKETGWLDEKKLALDSEGLTNVKGLMKLLPTAVRAMRRGKIPGKHQKIEGAEHIKRIISKAEATK